MDCLGSKWTVHGGQTVHVLNGQKADSGGPVINWMFQTTKYGRYKKRNWTIQKDESSRSKRLKVDGPKNSLWTVQKTECVRSERMKLYGP